MIEIAPYGTFFEMDADGHILNPTSWSHISAEFLPLIEAAKECFLRHHLDRLHAVYLRGSVPRGMPAAAIADLDIVGILRPLSGSEFVRWATPDWAETEEAALLGRFPVLKRIDFAVADRDIDIPGRNASVKFMLKTQGLCIWGMDDSLDWPAYKATREVAFQFRWLEHDLAKWRQEFALREDSVEKQAFLQSLSKTTIRAGMELVVERSGSYSIDLYPCMTAFGNHYPAQATQMRDALHSYLSPNDHAIGSRAWIESLIPFLIAESTVVLFSRSCGTNS